MKKVTNLFENKPKKKKPPQKMVKAASKTHSKVRRMMHQEASEHFKKQMHK